MINVVASEFKTIKRLNNYLQLHKVRQKDIIGIAKKEYMFEDAIYFLVCVERGKKDGTDE